MKDYNKNALISFLIVVLLPTTIIGIGLYFASIYNPKGVDEVWPTSEIHRKHEPTTIIIRF